MKIIISNNSKLSIKNIFNFSSNISTKYDNKVINNIYSTIDSIKFMPYIGRYVPEIPLKSFRERLSGNYRIIYFISEFDQTVYIKYIISSKQNSNLFFKVHKKELYDFFNKFFN